MKRRQFLRNTALGATLPFWLQECAVAPSADFPIDLHSDQAAGHLVFESQNWPMGGREAFDRVIVGGGVAGLAAAYKSRGQDFALFELSDRLGGTSASAQVGDIHFCQGAHYDLDYPEYYGDDVLRMLEELDIIHYQPWKRAWSFNDQQHIIPASRRQQCYDEGKIRGDVIPEGAVKDQFLEVIGQFAGQMALPTRLISEEVRFLNDIDFRSFLAEHMEVSQQLERQLDYHMMDDYGGGASQVSALAGIHYFMCRPYYSQPVSLFSPLQGNDYFVQRIANKLPANRVHLQHLVRRINDLGDQFEMEILDIAAQKVKVVTANHVVYAGQKHALQYVFPQEHSLFASNVYAPWMVINFISRQQEGEYGFWQNEFLAEDRSFLGFIDSSVQDRVSLGGRRILTAYYCLRPEDREYLSTVSQERERIVTEAQSQVRKVLPHMDSIERAAIKVMGHAMPIPTPGYLFRDANESNSRLAYAGVDNGRLPLLFEALDSGILAAERP